MPETNGSIKDSIGNEYRIEEKLSSGGQGIIYRISGHDDLLVKLVFSDANQNETKFTNEKSWKNKNRKILRVMAIEGEDRMTVPFATIKYPYCGYVMRLLEEMQPVKNLIDDYMKNNTMDYHGKIQKRKILLLCSLAEILERLHNRGLVYCDISDNNVFISEDNELSNAWLIDTDNLEYGREIKTCVKTDKFMAPELYNGMKNTAMSDCYSFAILAFMVLTGIGPFDGEEMNQDDWANGDEEPFEEKRNSGKVNYIYETNTNNPPVGGLSPANCMTDKLRSLFEKTFSLSGRMDPSSRPTMTEWTEALNEAADLLVRCDAGHWHFDQNCPFCSESEKKTNSEGKYYQLEFSRLLIYMDENEKETGRGYIPEHKCRFRIKNGNGTADLPIYIDKKKSINIIYSKNNRYPTVYSDYPFVVKNYKFNEKKPDEIEFDIIRGGKSRKSKEMIHCAVREEDQL